MMKTESFNTPILLIFFNREDTLAKVLEVIREKKAPILYLAQDGPRLGNSSDEKNCISCRELVESQIDWECEVKTLYRDENLGCKKAVSGAISWFFECEEEGIILEDDCVPHLSFFDYAQFMLKEYKDNEKIGMICGTNITNGRAAPVEEDIYFSKMPLVWGWASWRRVWKEYDVEISGWPKNNSVLSFLKNKIVYRNWKLIFNRVFMGRIDTWDYQLNYLLWNLQYLCVIPKNNLIENVGFDERATNTSSRPDHIPVLSDEGARTDSNWKLPKDYSVLLERDEIFLNDQVDSQTNILKSWILELLVVLKVFFIKIKRTNN